MQDTPPHPSPSRVDPDDLLGHVDWLRRLARVLVRDEASADDLDADEIARREGTSPSTVRSHLARGIAALRERLDRRAGGRDAWCAVLAPWVDFGAPLAPGPGGEIPVPSPTDALHATGLTGAAVGAAGVFAMTFKAAAIALVPLILAGVWYTTGDATVDVETTLARSGVGGDVERSELAAVVPRADDQREVLSVQSAAVAPAPYLNLLELKAGWARVEGQVIDALTGEPVPYLDLSIVEGDFDANGSKQSIGVVTDADGWFAGIFQSLPVGTVELTALDSHGGVLRALPKQVLTFPFEAPVEVRVGPTFHLDVPVDLDPATTRYRVIYAGSAAKVGNLTPSAIVRPGGAPGERPWVRFSDRALDIEGDGPWELLLYGEDGHTRGRAEVMRKFGVEPGLVTFHMEDLGTIEFSLALAAGMQIPGARVDVWLSGDDGEGRRDMRPVRLLRHDADGTIHGQLRHAAPGHYGWHFGAKGAGVNGEVDVVPGEATVVELTLADVGLTFDTHVLIDVTALEAFDHSSWTAFVARVDDPMSGSMAALTRDGSDPAGYLRIKLASLLEGQWIVGVHASEGVELTPSVVHLGSGDPPAVIVARPGGPRTAVTVTAVDAVTGEALSGVEAAYIVSITDTRYSNSSTNGVLEPESLPLDKEATIIVRAPGYAALSIRHMPSRDGLSVEARLMRGWSNRVVVVDLLRVEFVSDVSVSIDGEIVGRTDENGALQIPGKGLPKKIEIGTDDPSIQVHQSPFEEGPEDPLMGYLFVITRG